MRLTAGNAGLRACLVPSATRAEDLSPDRWHCAIARYPRATSLEGNVTVRSRKVGVDATAIPCRTLIAAIVFSVFFFLSSGRIAQADAPASFVGEKICASCHEPEATLWQGSHHERAMAVADDTTVLGNFGSATLTHYGVTSTFYKKDGKFHVRTDGPDGTLQDYEIAYTFGVYPLQQYLIAFPGGRYQALGIAWDSRPAEQGGQRWFHLYPDQEIKAGDSLHWTGLNQTWNYMCADCHSTDLHKNFDLVTNSYETRWAEINVACEACHGPGSRHVAWAKATSTGAVPDATDEELKGLTVSLSDRSGGHWVVDPDSGMPVHSGPPTLSLQIDTCARCHSRRYEIAPQFLYGSPLLDSEQPSLLDAGLYHSDGQILGEVYEYGSFLQSLMGQKGVLCADCHDPHSLQLRAAGNEVCGQCHLQAKFDTEAHSHHPMGSAGAQCVSCHMPTRTYMVVDVRRDHSIRIPRPDLSIALGTPNACNSCHTERSALWAAEAIAKWYGPDRRQEPHYGSTIDAARKGLPGAGPALAALSTDKSEPAIVRATAISLLTPFAGSITPEMAKAYPDALKDEDPLVRAAAVNALDPFAPRDRLPLVAPLLQDKIRAVRIAAARSLAPVPTAVLTPQQRFDFDRDSDELVAAEMASSDRPEAHLSLGAFYAQAGQVAKAEAAYRQALLLDPRFTPALVNLADLYRQLNRDADAEPLLRQAITIDPQDPTAHESLGLLAARQGRLPEALTQLRNASELAPGNSRYAYVYAVALHSAGKSSEALDALRRAHQEDPADFDILYALATMSRDIGDTKSALDFARRLLQIAPDNPDAQALLNSLGNP